MSRQLTDLPEISLVVCTYNRPEELLRLVNSMQNQTYTPNQLIVVDASDQATLIACDSPRMSIIKMPRGLTRQRNAGARVATSEVVVFADDDEVLIEGCLEGVARGLQG